VQENIFDALIKVIEKVDDDRDKRMEVNSKIQDDIKAKQEEQIRFMLKKNDLANQIEILQKDIDKGIVALTDLKNKVSNDGDKLADFKAK